MGSELASQEFGEVYMTWVDEPPHGQRLRILAAGRRVLITVQLLALIEAGESPWASLSGVARAFPPGDPYGYEGALLRIEAGNRTVTYRAGGYQPAHRSYVAELQEETPRAAIMEADPA